MSYALSLHRTARYLSRFRYADFLIKSTPLISVTFVLYVIIQGSL